MAQTTRKITLSVSRDIPFNKLLLSGCNVRRIKAGVSLSELADDIARRGLLQSLTVRPVLDNDGAESGMYEIPAGGRRYRALELLVRQKRLARTALIPCVVRTEGIAEEDSLAENVQRAPLHPLDQFRAFQTLREKGQSEEDIAATFFVSIAVVKQRLRLAAVSPRLLDAYAEDGLSLEQVMAFAVSGDHERQEQVFDRLQSHTSKEPPVIRRMLTEGAVRASDKRALFVGTAAYEAAGGIVLRDLFQADGGGWLQDVGLLERLVAERLEREAALIRAEGWRWVEAAPDFPYGHSFGLRQLRGETVPLSEAEDAELEALRTEYCNLEAAHAHDEGVPDEVDRRLSEIEQTVAAFDERPMIYDPVEIGRAGAFVSIDGDGQLRVDRGYVRPEDEVPAGPAADLDHNPDETAAATAAMPASGPPRVSRTAPGEASGPSGRASPVNGEADPASDNEQTQIGPNTTDPNAVEPEGTDTSTPLPDRLMSELTAFHTLALQHALGERPDVAFLAALHALCLTLFYPVTQDSCLQLALRQVAFSAQPPGLAESEPAKAMERRHQDWTGKLPHQAADLWDALVAADDDMRQRLFAHCVSASINAVHEAWNRRPKALAHAGELASAVRLDLAAPAVGWRPTVENYLGRVSKARILQAVREAKGEAAAARIAQLKKGEMAAQAQDLLADTGWLPEPLRTAAQNQIAPPAVPSMDGASQTETAQTRTAEQPAEADAHWAADSNDPAFAQASAGHGEEGWQSAAD